MNKQVAKYRAMKADMLAEMQESIKTKYDDEQIHQIISDTAVFLRETKEFYTTIAVGEERA